MLTTEGTDKTLLLMLYDLNNSEILEVKSDFPNDVCILETNTGDIIGVKPESDHITFIYGQLIHHSDETTRLNKMATRIFKYLGDLLTTKICIVYK